MDKLPKRILLKVSGEALMGDKKFGHDHNIIELIAKDIKEVVDLGIEVCIVVGGGNICRGQVASDLGIDRASGDHMGMLATTINALALQNVIARQNLQVRVQSAISMIKICEPFIRQKAIRHMEKGRIVIFAAGIGNPFFTTDSAAALRSIEMKCDYLIKGTHVDGVYDSDPKTNPNAKRYTKISYDDVLQKNLKVMDMAAISVARENNMPIKVFSIKTPGNLLHVLRGQGKFTLIN